MIEREDDAAPLLHSFTRGSSLRTATRKKGGDHLQYPSAVGAKPPLPPRPAQLPPARDDRLRSASVTEGEDNRALDTLRLQNAAVQALAGRGGAEEPRDPSQPARGMQRAHSTRPTPREDTQSHADGSSVSTLQRNGVHSASLPSRRKTTSVFFWPLRSPSAIRRMLGQKTERPSPEQEASTASKLCSKNEMPAKSCRGQQPPLPPKPAFLPLHLNLVGPPTPAREQLKCSFTKQETAPARENSHPRQRTRGVTVGRSNSFQHPRLRPRCRDSLAPVTTHQAERLCNNTLPSPGVAYPGGWAAEGSWVNLKNPDGTGGQQGRRGVWRHSSLPRPALAWRNSVAEPRTHDQLPGLARRGLTPTQIPMPTTPTTPAATTTNCPFSPRTYRRCESLNLEVRGPCPPRRLGSLGGSRGLGGKDGDGEGYINEAACLRTRSSDSGYSTCSSWSNVSRRNSVISECEEDVTEWFGSRLNLEEETLSVGPPTDHFTYLMEKETEYLQCLRSMLDDYQAMCRKTPSLIRQHFDLIFKQVNIIYQFQLVLQEALQETHGDPQQLASVFSNEQFQCYGHLMVLTPAVQEDLMQHAAHIKEHFPDLRRNILKPSLRINFYTLILDSFRKEAAEQEVKKHLQAAIDFLNQVKRKANTEMTLSTVVQSPVDLRLGGDMLHMGELTCTGGAALQKKKYQLILFENLLVVTSKRVSWFKYKTHYRVGQLEAVAAVGDHELHLSVLPGGQKQPATLKFTTKYPKVRDEWLAELQKITQRNARLSRGRGSITLRAPRQRHHMLPLDLTRVFPLLRKVIDAKVEAGESNAEWSWSGMESLEDKYIEKLSETFNPEYVRPPDELSGLLESLYKVHKKLFLPALQRSQTASDFLDCLVESLDELAVYVDYLVVRSQLTVELDEVPEAGEYILPVQHLYGVYFGLLKELCSSDRCRNKAWRVVQRLQRHVEAAQLRVQEEAILNCRVDFKRSGKLLVYSPLEVKARKNEVRAGDYIGLLFEKVIVLTRQKQPYYEYVTDIWLDQANFGPPAKDECTFQLEVRQGGGKEPVTWDMRARTHEIKNTWQRHLQKQLLAQMNKVRQKSWVRDL